MNIGWASSCKTGLKKILLKQKHTVRIIFHEDCLTHSRPLLKSLNALNVYQVNIFQICSFMYQVKNVTKPKIFSNNFSSVDHYYPTRFASNSFQFPKSSKPQKVFCFITWTKIMERDFDK